MNKVKLSQYDNSSYNPGSKLKKALWYFVNICVFKTGIPFTSGFKIKMLKLFGAQVGKGIVIKPNVNIKYPWFLTLGDNCWIGEEVWIDNLVQVTIGNDVCLSQGAYLLTGSHNYKQEAFDLITKPIVLEEGVWIGAKATVSPGINCKSHSILTVGSVATKDLDAYGIYQGNPAVWKRKREIS